MKTIWVDLNSGTYGEAPVVVINLDDDQVEMVARMTDSERIEFAKAQVMWRKSQ
jgi:hypothetical protein